MILSAPSYIIPGTYLENVKFISTLSEIKNIELLFFYFDRETKELFLNEKKEIKEFKENKRFRFTVHMPDEINQTHAEIIEMTLDLADFYIIHPPSSHFESIAHLIENWQTDYGRIFLIENLIGRQVTDVIRYMNFFQLCLDTGHLLIQDLDPQLFIDQYEPYIQEIHLHGICGTRDHQDFHKNEAWFKSMINFLKNFPGIVNIEVFNLSHLLNIMSHLKDYHLI